LPGFMKRLTITNYETKGDLPNLFIFNNGSNVSSHKDWERRRKEIYQTAVSAPLWICRSTPSIRRVTATFPDVGRRVGVTSANRDSY